MTTLTIGLIGDYRPDVKAHIAIPQAIALAAADLGCKAEGVWRTTPEWERVPEETIAGYDALWCVPASPYQSMEGALRLIRFAREQNIPFLGTCGGSQHALIEYARNVLGLDEADHAESNPDTSLPLIAPLACALVEQEDTILFRPGSRIASIYGRSEATEQYHCSFGLNPAYHSLFEQSGLQITGEDRNGEARVFELAGHPFFIATLFQPERSAFKGVVHPLIKAFLQATTEEKTKQPPRINKIRSPKRWV
jgi:CTP synthase (UTP-ammonia lyase)